MGPTLLKCRDVSELVTDYAEGTLPPGRRLAVRLHLMFCSMCRNYLDQMTKTRALLKRTPLAPPSDAEIERILAKPPAE